MTYILWMVALLEACCVTNNDRHLGIQGLIYKLILLSYFFLLEKTDKHKQVMSAIVTTVLRGTIGLLLKKGRQSASKKLRDGDVADEQLRSLIVDEMDNVNSKLDAMARKDLGASISHFKQGVILLNKAMNTKTCSKGSLNVVPAALGRDEDMKEDKRGKNNPNITSEAGDKGASWSGKFFSFANPLGSLFVKGKKEEKTSGTASQTTEEMMAGAAEKNESSTLRGELMKLNLNSLDENAMLDAKKRFDDARRKATDAFCNEVLNPVDRILAMGVRLMATLLEKVDNPVNSLDLCISDLNELHSQPFVKENFRLELWKGIKSKFSKGERKQIVSMVCQINRIIYEFTSLVRTEDQTFYFLPCVQVGEEEIDPLRDSRMLKTLRKQKMGDCSLAWSFGQEGQQENQVLKSAVSIATNTAGEFLVVDSKDKCVKKYDIYGNLTISGHPENMTDFRIVAAATDSDDSIYVLLSGVEFSNNRALLARVCVFDPLLQFKHEFAVGSNLEAVTVKTTNNHVLLVPGSFPGLVTPSPSLAGTLNEVYMVTSNPSGEEICQFSIKTCGKIQDIIAGDNCIMVLNAESMVFVFTSSNDSPVSHLVETFLVQVNARAITYHPRSKHVIVASQTKSYRSQLLFYSKRGKLERSIDLDVEKGYEITAAAVTRDGRICIATSNYLEEKGKVLVL